MDNKQSNEYVGQIRKMNCGTPCQCIAYRNSDDCDFMFLDEFQYIVMHRTYASFRKGTIKNPYVRFLYGKGYVGPIPSSRTHEYKVWIYMFHRCYREPRNRRDIRYIDCEVDEEWYDFQKFSQWYKEQLINYRIDEKCHINKDLLVKNNKVYKSDRCMIIPERLNLFISGTSHTGKHELGVRYDKSRDSFTAVCCDPFDKTHIQKYHGRFKTEHEAHLAYLEAKIKYAEKLANYYDGLIDQRAIDKLRNFRIFLEE